MSNKRVSLSIWPLLVIATNSRSGGTCASRPRPAICHRMCVLFQHCFNSLARTMDRLFHHPNLTAGPELWRVYRMHAYMPREGEDARVTQVFSGSFSGAFSVSESVGLLLPVRAFAAQLSGRTWPHPIYGHIPKGEHTCPERIGTLRERTREILL